MPAVLSVLSDYHGKFMIESFNPFTLMRLRKSRPDIVRGQLSDAFMRKKKGRTATDFVLASFSLNFLSRPDFLSYGIENCDSFAYNVIKKYIGSLRSPGPSKIRTRNHAQKNTVLTR